MHMPDTEGAIKEMYRVLRPGGRLVFLTNSLRFIRPVTALDREQLPQADLAPLVQSLCEAARLQCGHDPRMVDLGKAGR
mgnify:CR=1 FL=1